MRRVIFLIDWIGFLKLRNDLFTKDLRSITLTVTGVAGWAMRHSTSNAFFFSFHVYFNLLLHSCISLKYTLSLVPSTVRDYHNSVDCKLLIFIYDFNSAVGHMITRVPSA